jgi:hypothetical protein
MPTLQKQLSRLVRSKPTENIQSYHLFICQLAYFQTDAISPTTQKQQIELLTLASKQLKNEAVETDCQALPKCATIESKLQTFVRLFKSRVV